MSDEEAFLNDFRPGEWESRFTCELPKNKTISLNIDPDYVPHWSGQEAFRELYQNWVDGMAKAANLDLRDIEVVRQESAGGTSNNAIMIHAYPRKITSVKIERARGPRLLLGYIRFTPSLQDRDRGSLEITNFGASLNERHLNLGGTTKAKDPGQAGQHGEGLKLLAHILTGKKYNYSVRLHTSRRTWRFFLDANLELKCQIKAPDQDMKKAAVETRRQIHKAQEEHRERPCMADVDNDVCVRIGEARDIRSAKYLTGQSRKTPQIHIKELYKWFEYILDLHPDRTDANIIKTTRGDLLLEERFAGSLFLRGLLLPGGSASPKELRYSYNFVGGSVDRDRRSMGNHAQEARHILDIWRAALLDHSVECDKKTLVSNFVEMLLEDKTADSNGFLKGSADKPLATMVWAELRRSFDGKKFCHGQDDKSESIAIIEHSLHLEASLLKEELWDWLRSYHLCRTPREERDYRFDRASVVGVPDTSFARHIDQLLRAGLLLNAETEQTKITYVESLGLGVDVRYIAAIDTFRIDQKWLDPAAAHQNEVCERIELEESTTGVFRCDHLLIELYGLMMDEWKNATSESEAELKVRKRLMKGTVRERIISMPRHVQLRQMQNGLEVTWETPCRVLAIRCNSQSDLVVLHRSGCPRINDIVYKQLADERCLCASMNKEVTMESLKDGLRLHFSPLADGDYVATVAKGMHGSIFSLPSPTVSFRNAAKPKDAPLHSAASRSLGGSVLRPRQNPVVRGSSSIESGDVNTSRPDSTSPPAAALHSGGSTTASLDPILNHPDELSQGRDVNEEAAPKNSVAENTTFILARIPKAPLAFGELPWQSGFPGTHQWYRANESDAYLAICTRDGVTSESAELQVNKEQVTWDIGDSDSLYTTSRRLTPNAVKMEDTDDSMQTLRGRKRQRAGSVTRGYTVINLD